MNIIRNHIRSGRKNIGYTQNLPIIVTTKKGRVFFAYLTWLEMWKVTKKKGFDILSTFSDW